MDALIYLSCGVIAVLHPVEYMDELFHAPMVERYLEGYWMEWDPKITTLPGVYVIMVAVLKVTQIHKVLGVLISCRAVNSFCYGVFIRRLAVLDVQNQDLVMLLPPLFFTSFLFYTDPLATITVLISYKLLRSNRPYLSACIGALSVLCRQTNIIWIGASVLYQLIFQSNSKTVMSLARYCFKNASRILIEYGVHLIVCITFCMFVVYNGGVVVGDKIHHTPVLHISQVCYLSLILAIYLPIDINSAARSIKSLCSLLGLGMILICSYIVKYYSYEHPFLLSDNTHYTFYIWRYLKEVNIYLAPLYVASLFYLYHRFSYKPLIFYSWLLCSAVALVPAQLIEPRYFIMPMIFYMVQDGKKASRLRIGCLVVLNVATVVVFGWRPYKGIAFMW